VGALIVCILLLRHVSSIPYGSFASYGSSLAASSPGRRDNSCQARQVDSPVAPPSSKDWTAISVSAASEREVPADVLQQPNTRPTSHNRSFPAIATSACTRCLESRAYSAQRPAGAPCPSLLDHCNRTNNAPHRRDQHIARQTRRHHHTQRPWTSLGGSYSDRLSLIYLPPAQMGYRFPCGNGVEHNGQERCLAMPRLRFQGLKMASSAREMIACRMMGPVIWLRILSDRLPYIRGGRRSRRQEGCLPMYGVRLITYRILS
jgi:hypothetical protein